MSAPKVTSERWFAFLCCGVLVAACSSSPGSPDAAGRGGAGGTVGGRGGAGAQGGAGMGGSAGRGGTGGGSAGRGGTGGGSAGRGGTGGSAGTGAVAGTGGNAGSGGSAGIPGTGGTAGMGGGGSGGSAGSAGTGGTGGTPTPPDNLRYWFEADFGVTVDTAGHVTDWVDQANPPDRSWDVHTPMGGSTPPTVVANEINGRPGIYFGTQGDGGASNWSLAHYGGPGYKGPSGSFPLETPYPFAENEAHIVYVVCKPYKAPSPGPGISLWGGMLITDRSTFSRQLWTLSTAQQRVARSTAPTRATLLSVQNPVDYTANPLLIVYQWTGSEMRVTVNEGPVLTTIDLINGGPSSEFPAVPDGTGNHVIEIGGSPIDESGFQGTIEAVMLAAEDAPNRQTIDYLEAKWGPFPTISTMVTNRARGAR